MKRIIVEFRNGFTHTATIRGDQPSLVRAVEVAMDVYHAVYKSHGQISGTREEAVDE